MYSLYPLIFFAGTIKKDSSNKQVLDKLQVERERGITVKAQVSATFRNGVFNYILIIRLMTNNNRIINNRIVINIYESLSNDSYIYVYDNSVILNRSNIYFQVHILIQPDFCRYL